jgi:aminopeptidase N
MRYIVTIVCLLSALNLTAQHHPHFCSRGKLHTAKKADGTAPVSVPEEEYYDLHYLFFDISMTNTSTTVSGSVTAQANVVADQMDQYVFELTEELMVDSVLINGQRLPVVEAGKICRVTLPAPLPRDAAFSAKVFYRGRPDGGYGAVGEGITSVVDDRWPVHVTYTLSEPWFASDWWPCKQSLGDKIDSMDMWITVPAGLMAGSNGLLQRVTPVGGDSLRFEWRSRYPIDYYLISASVAPYTEYARYMHFSPTDSMLLQDYIYDYPGLMEQFKPGMDSTEMMIHYFSEVLGRYPFDREKYGHCLAPIWGGMEHQTMTTLRHFGFDLVAHELAHQWFGDYVTCGSWRDIWLNEGFASYSEYLAQAALRGDTAAASWMRNTHAYVLDEPELGGSVYVPDTSSFERVFSGRLTYDKSASVVHMLRYVINNDSFFFSAIRDYLAQHAYGTAFTPALKQSFEETAQLNLDSFFRQWIYGEGFLHVRVKWNQMNGHLLLQVSPEGTVPASVPYFTTPVDIKIRSAGRDTLLRISCDQPVTTVVLPWPDPVVEVVVDPDNWLLNTETVTKDPALADAAYLPSPPPFVYPNPAADHWRVVLISPGTELRLTDMAGRTVLRQTITDSSVELPARHLSSGVYLLELRTPEGDRHYRKLWRR